VLLRRFFKKEHAAAVNDTRPISGDKHQFEPYVVAMCECDWVGDFHTTVEDAFRDAFEHTENVDRVVSVRSAEDSSGFSRFRVLRSPP